MDFEIPSISRVLHVHERGEPRPGLHI